MGSLVLTVVASICIAAILRFNEDRGGERLVVAGANYIVAAILSWILAVDAGIDLGGGAFAVAVGLGFAGGFIVLMRAIGEVGLAVPATAARLSTIVPVVGSVFLFQESPSPLQLAGIGLGIIAFVVLGHAQNRRNRRDGLAARSVLLLIAVFMIAGCVDFSLKVAQEIGLGGGFLVVVFASAFIVCGIGVALQRTRIRIRDIAIGTLLGVPNFAASYYLLLALEDLDGIVVFPAMNASVVIGVSVVAIIVWREKPDVATACGLALATVAVVLLGLG